MPNVIRKRSVAPYTSFKFDLPCIYDVTLPGTKFCHQRIETNILMGGFSRKFLRVTGSGWVVDLVSPTPTSGPSPSNFKKGPLKLQVGLAFSDKSLQVTPLYPPPPSLMKELIRHPLLLVLLDERLLPTFSFFRKRYPTRVQFPVN